MRLKVINKAEFFRLISEDPAIKEAVDQYIVQRLYHYQKLFISRIQNSPQRRIEELLASQPELFEKVPHHYIANDLGITPVSLSRI